MPTSERVGAPTDDARATGCIPQVVVKRTSMKRTSGGHEAGGEREHEVGGEGDAEATSGGRNVLEGRGQLGDPPPRPLDQSASYRHDHVSAWKSLPFPER